MRIRQWVPATGALLAVLSWSGIGLAAPPERANIQDEMSPAGQIAARARAEIGRLAAKGAKPGQDPPCEACDDNQGPTGGQAELSIAIDSTGQHVVIGFNDTRGFSLNPIRVSGYMYSDDGGKTFTDGGQLPSPGTDSIGGTLLPQIYGDPEVKYLGACTFIYSSIIVAKFSDTEAVQTLGVHRSTDCGHTWVGPFEVTAATNPNGGLDGSGAPLDAADKEFMDVDPDTGRVMISWTNFTPYSPSFVEIAVSYTDDIMADPPTWAPRIVVSADEADGQSSIPRFAGNGSNDAYVAWRRFGPGTQAIAFARSSDNGATWEAPIEISPYFKAMDQVLGNDRVNSSPSMAVELGPGPRSGWIYVVYADNDNNDGADIALQKSRDGGRTWDPQVLVNASPGKDRAQWFPWISLDRFSGRLDIFYYDQKIDRSGDRTEVSLRTSFDGGTHFRAQRPLTEVFHAGWGNDTGQPNLGDYNQSVTQKGELFASFGWSPPPPRGFVDGQPTSLSMTVPDVGFRRLGRTLQDLLGVLPLDLQDPTESGTGNGHIDPGERVNLRLPLRNYDTNLLAASTLYGVSARVSTKTPGVQVDRGWAYYGTIAPGQTRQNLLPFTLEIDDDFVPGTKIELEISVIAAGLATTHLEHTLFTGTPEATTLVSENFEAAAPGSLPTGWRAVHGAGDNTVPWTTTTGFCGGSNAAFHPNAEDGPAGGSPARWERLYSPSFTVPADAEYVIVEFDVCYDTEDDPAYRIQAYDGAFLRVTDLTTGHLLRSVLVEAFDDWFFTGPLRHYPKHLPRSSDPRYFEDMSVWAGDSAGIRRVRMRLPGMAGTTAQLRFEYTQDSNSTCADVRPGHACGISVDNVVVKSVVSTAPAED